VREFQVIRAGATAEIGRTNAGFVNVVTKSGDNRWRGELFYMNRNRALTSADAFGRKLDNQQSQFGGAVGGPLRRDRAFIFAGAEQNLLRVPFVVQFRPQPDGTVVPAELSGWAGTRHRTNDPTSAFLRTDVHLNSRDSLNLSYMYSRLVGRNFDMELTPQPEYAESTNYTRTGLSHGLKAGFLSVFTPDVINELRAQAATDDRRERPNSPWAHVNIAGFGRVGGPTSRPRRFDATRYQATDNLSLSRGRHQTRFGFDLNLNRVDQSRTVNLQGRYDFASLADYVNRRINRYRQTLPAAGPPDLALRGTQTELAFYAQDKIALHPHLTVTAGLRWEGQWNPQPPRPNPLIPETARVPHDLGQWQPRLGLAWDFRGRGTTVLRLSSGLYAARTPVTLLQRAFTENGVSTVLLDSRVDRAVLNWVQFPYPLDSVPAGIQPGLADVVGFAPGFRNPRSFQAAATLERLLGRRYVLTLGYTHHATWNLQRRLDRNLFPPTADATGMPIFPRERPDPTIRRLAINESSAHAGYDGLVLGVARTLTRRLRLQANYTLARAVDDDSNERNFRRDSALNPFDLAPERAYSKQDVRHNFNLNGLAELPGRFTFGAILITHSAFPYTPVIGSDAQNDGNDDNDRAVINGRVARRHSRRGPAFFNLDLRLTRRFRRGETRHLELVAEVFNVTRAGNRYYGPDSVSEFGTPGRPVPAAGQPLYAPSPDRFGGPRQLQLGLRWVF